MNTLKDFVNWKLTHADKTADAEGYPLAMENCKVNKKMKQLEVYGNSVQDGTPTPDTPIEVQSVGELVTDSADANYGKYKIPVVQRGKNIYTATTVIQTNRLTAIDTIKVKPHTDYRITVDNYTISSPLWEIRGVDEPMTNISNPWQIGEKITGATSVFNSGNYEYVVIRAWAENSTYGIDVTTKIQIEEGTTATEFEPYVEPIITNVFLDEPLRKIGEYVDYIDFKDNKVIRRNYRQPINSSFGTSWAKGTDAWQRDGHFDVVISSFYKYVPIREKYGYSNRFIRGNWVWGANKFPNNYFYVWDNKNAHLIMQLDYLDGITEDSTDTEKINAIKSFLDNNETYSIYPLQTPIEEPLDIELPKLKAKTSIIEVDTSVAPSNAYGKYIKK